MSALTFDKNELGNLEYSLQREMLATDRRGGYMSTTIVCCNTRKYHGLIVAPIDDSDRDFVLLSSLDETIIHGEHRFNLALHRFNGTYEPRGHKYITDFQYTPTPSIIYRIGDLVLRKELLWIHKRTQLMVRYTLLESQDESVTLQLRPFLAFRDRHELSKANMFANVRSYPITAGVKCRMYDGFPWLNMQVDAKEFEYVPAPDWYYDFEYPQEAARGYDDKEDLLTPGYFEMNIERGKSVIFSASTDEMFSSDVITEAYDLSIARRTHKVDFLSCLHHSARQFIIRHADGSTSVEAGYPWYGLVGREMMFSLPGLTLEQDHALDCIDALNTFVKNLNENRLHPSLHPYNAADAPLWFFRTLQCLEVKIGKEEIWKHYGEAMIKILEWYKAGIGEGRIALHDNGLIWTWTNDAPITWVDQTVSASSRRFRNGYLNDLNALWYNAVCYTLELAKEFRNNEFVSVWGSMPELTKASFLDKFWDASENKLADYVTNDYTYSSLHINMLTVCALNYKMLDEIQIYELIQKTRQFLLTNKGIRSISPINPIYGQRNESNERNGSVWVWPLLLYVKACFDIAGKDFLPEAVEIIEYFKDDIQTYGIGSIGEYYEADPPHVTKGSISQAWSVGAVLEIIDLCRKYNDMPDAVAPVKKRAPRKTSTTATKPKAAAKPKATATKTKTKTTKTTTTTAKAPRKRAVKAE